MVILFVSDRIYKLFKIRIFRKSFNSRTDILRDIHRGAI